MASHRFFAPFPLAFALSVALAGVASPVRADSWQQQAGPFGGSVLALDRIATGAVYAMGGDAVFRTTDDGAHWTHLGPTTTFTLLDLDVTESGAIWAGTSTRGVAWSLNGGLTWTNNQITTNPHSGLGATIVAIAVDAQGRILAGSFRSVNQGASFTQMSIAGNVFAFDATGRALAGTSNGVWRSSDGGASWTPLNAGMAGQNVWSLAASGASDLWAGTLAGAIWRSTDAGVSWTAAVAGLPGDAIRTLEALPDRVLAAAGSGLFRSTDGGLTWSGTGAGLGVVQDLVPDAGELWIGTTGHGPYRSLDGGDTAVPAAAAEMFAPGLAAIAVDADGALYLASSQSGIFRSADGGHAWARADAGLSSPVVAAVAAGPAGQAWAATWNGIAATTDGGESWTPSGFDGHRSFGIARTMPGSLIALVQNDSGLPVVDRSTDAGQNWAEVYGAPDVFLLEAAHPTVGGSLLVGGSSFFGGVALRSTDDGATWTDVWSAASGVKALASGPGNLAWAAGDENVVYRSTDDGSSWTPLPQGGWPGGTVGSLRDLEYAPQGLFLVASGRVYRSIDDGDSWAEFDEGFPPGANADFVASTPSGLLAGTASSGMFRLEGAATSAPALPAPLARLHVAPNPFRDVARVSWELPRTADVRVTVHDVRGRRVGELIAGRQPAGPGTLSWDGTTGDGRTVAPGTYFLRFESEGRTADAKVLRVR